MTNYYIIPPTNIYPSIPPTNVYPDYTLSTTVLPKTTAQPQPATPSLDDAFKPKRAGKDSSHIIFVLDDSSSMQQSRANTISGFNEYLAGQKADAVSSGIKTYVSLYKFNGSDVKCVIDHKDVAEVEDLTMQSYDPRGNTNLHDAIGGVMMATNARLAASKKKNRESVIIAILTDGQENVSRTFNGNTIKAMVEKAEGKNWGFMFLGANIDAFDTGATLGFRSANTVQYTNDSAGNSIRAASAMTSRLKSAYSAGINTTMAYADNGFTDAERALAVTRDDK